MTSLIKEIKYLKKLEIDIRFFLLYKYNLLKKIKSKFGNGLDIEANMSHDLR